MTSYRIKDVAQINRCTLSEDTDPQYTFRYIDIGSVSKAGSLLVPEDETTFTSAPSRARRIAPPGSTIVSTVRTYLRTVATIPEHDADLVFSTGFAILEANDKVDSRFLGHYCLSQPFIDEVVSRSTGVSYPAINPSEIGNVPITFPPLDEQRRIADFLDAETARIGRLAELRRQQLVAIKERHEAAHLEGIQELNAEWIPLRRLGATASTGPFGTQFNADDYEADGIPMINTAQIQGGRLAPDSRHAVSEGTAKRLSRHRLKPGDIVIARKRHLGRAAAVKPSQAGWLCGTDSISLTVYEKHTYPEFVERLLRSRYVRSQLLKNSLAATIPNLNEGNLLDLQVPLVPLEKQRDFCSRLAKVDHVLADVSKAMIRQVEVLTERRQALITAAVTGQFDVSTASGRNVTDGVPAS